MVVLTDTEERNKMNPNDFKKGDYVSIHDRDGNREGYGTVAQESYSGCWVTELDGTSVLIPRERLRRVAKVTQDPKEVVSVPHPDPVTRAQEEYDRLVQEQAGIDTRNAEREAEKDRLRKEQERLNRHIRAANEQRKVNSQRMTELKTFLRLAETI